jgi:hypothetical protein
VESRKRVAKGMVNDILKIAKPSLMKMAMKMITVATWSIEK